jgi:hypothetical protein
MCTCSVSNYKSQGIKELHFWFLSDPGASFVPYPSQVLVESIKHNCLRQFPCVTWSSCHKIAHFRTPLRSLGSQGWGRYKTCMEFYTSSLAFKMDAICFPWLKKHRMWDHFPICKVMQNVVACWVSFLQGGLLTKILKEYGFFSLDFYFRSIFFLILLFNIRFVFLLSYFTFMIWIASLTS